MTYVKAWDEIRKLFGVLFQDGALFGSMNLFDNIAFPLREHTKKSESEIKSIVLEKMDMVGLQGAEGKLPGEISGGMRKRAGLARALVLDPEIILFDEPDSGLDPVRVAYLNQLIVDLNAQIDAGARDTAKAREVRGADRVVVRDGDAISALLTRMGAHDAVLAWEERRMRREVRATANRLANFDDANLRRSARAAVAASARVERALEILDGDAPEHLLVAGRLRLEHGQASLEELGQRAEPPMTKDAVAGRIRRLLAMADKRAKDLGIPDTESVVTEDMLTQ